MKTGIYKVSFHSNSQSAGQGIVVLKDGAVNGGDAGYTFTGLVNGPDNGLTARIGVQRWNSASVSIFGPLQKFDLELIGAASNDGSFTLTGSIAGRPAHKITIKGTFLAAAA